MVQSTVKRLSSFNLQSVNILFQCPSLSCHICSVVYPLTFLLKGKVYLKHAWSDLLFPPAGTGHDQKSGLSYRVTLTKGETKEKKEKANRASIKILPLKGNLKCTDAPLYCIYFNLSYWISFFGKLVWGTWKRPFASLHNISFVSEHIQSPKHRQPSRHLEMDQRYKRVWQIAKLFLWFLLIGFGMQKCGECLCRFERGLRLTTPEP